jgi:hypothetical protein
MARTDTRARIRDDSTAGSSRSWTVRVLYDAVIAVYGWEMSPHERHHAEGYAERFAAALGLPVREYEVPYDLADPPDVGTEVDCAALGWIPVGGRPALGLVEGISAR